jgi:phage gpG-like protein
VTDYAVTVDTSRLEARLAALPGKLQASLTRAVQRLSIKLQGNVMASKLSGQVLHVRTGTLRRSINQKVEQSGNTIRGSVGTNVEYAAIHEYGGTIFIPPRIRKTHFKMDKYGNIKQGFAKKREANLTKEHAARSFGTHVTFPERSFLRSALKDMEPEILATLNEATAEAVK